MLLFAAVHLGRREAEMGAVEPGGQESPPPEEPEAGFLRQEDAGAGFPIPFRSRARAHFHPGNSSNGPSLEIPPGLCEDWAGEPGPRFGGVFRTGNVPVRASHPGKSRDPPRRRVSLRFNPEKRINYARGVPQVART